jgi:type II secretion system protein C
VTTVLGLAASFVATRILARLLSLPEDAELLDLASLLSGDVEEDEPRRTIATPAQPAQRAKSSWVQPIVRRSIFDSSQVGSDVALGDVDTEDCRKTDLGVVLYATMVTIPEQFSSALIGEAKSDEYPNGYGIGDEVGGKRIFRIEQKKVVFEVGGQLECLVIDGEDFVRVQRSGTGEPGDGQVTAEGDNKFIVDESLITDALANPEALATQIRAVPHKGADGNIDGYRLSGIRKGSFFDKLGVKNGDIIHSVNGKELNSVSAAMEAYQSLSAEKTFNFDMTRRNQRQSMDYEVR